MTKFCEHINTQKDTVRFVHITDTHLLNRADQIFNKINTVQTLEAVLAQCLKRYPNIDFLLFTGDISQTATKKSYELFKSIIDRYQTPIYCVPGNHDKPKLLKNIMPNSPNDSITIIKHGKFSLILINSSVDNEHHGLISKTCLQKIKKHLQSNSDECNIIALHHHPININSPWLDEIALQNRNEFLETIHNSFRNVLILFGHVHQEIDIQQNKVRVLSTPSTCYQFKTSSKTMHHTYYPRPSYRYVHLTAPNQINTIVHHIR